MSSAATPFGRNERPPAPIAPRWSRPSGRKNAHRGLAACRRPASGKPCSQVLVASGKSRRSPTTARRAHLLPQRNPKSCVSPAVRGAQGVVGAGEAIGGLVQSIGGAADILASVVGAPETGGASLLRIAPGAASLTLGAATLGDGLSLIHAAFTGSGNAPTLEGSIGQQYGGTTGEQVGDLVGVGGQVVSAALSPAGTAETAAANAAMMALSNVLPNAGTVCGQ